MTKFVINGSGDEARAELKANLDAQDAKFNASLGAFFKSPAPTAAVPVAAEPPAPKPAIAGRSRLGTTREHPAARSRTSLLR